MRRSTLSLTLAMCMSAVMPGPVQASGEIQRACLKADRPAATRALCGCIQDVAETMFSQSERKRIAKFFKDPHATQELRQSGRSPDERFWDKYKTFGQVAKATCG